MNIGSMIEGKMLKNSNPRGSSRFGRPVRFGKPVNCRAAADRLRSDQYQRAGLEIRSSNDVGNDAGPIFMAASR